MEASAWLEVAPQARVWRWRLVGDRIPVERTVDVANAVIAGLNETARCLFGSNRLPPDLHPDAPCVLVDGLDRHRHAFFLPEDLDLDGRLDHFAVAIAANLGGEGFTRKGLTLLAACPGFWLKASADVRLEPIGLWSACPLGTDAPARVWLSLTPFVPPLHRLEAREQIALSLARLGLPVPLGIEPIATATASGGRTIAARAFVPLGPATKRWRSDLAAREDAMAYWRLDFADPVPGPLVLGALCHFGLGRFASAGE